MTTTFLRHVVLLAIAVAIMTPLQFAHATTPSLPPCFHYSFKETYNLDTRSLPNGVSLFQTSNNYFLRNTSSKPLIITLTVPGTTGQLKLVDGKAYRTAIGSETRWYEEKQEDYGPASSLPMLARLAKDILFVGSYSSNAKPSTPSPVRFSISGNYDGNPLVITGTLTYLPQENNCGQPQVEAFDSGGMWTVIRDFFLGLKFW